MLSQLTDCVSFHGLAILGCLNLTVLTLSQTLPKKIKKEVLSHLLSKILNFPFGERR